MLLSLWLDNNCVGYEKSMGMNIICVWVSTSDDTGWQGRKKGTGRDEKEKFFNTSSSSWWHTGKNVIFFLCDGAFNGIVAL